MYAKVNQNKLTIAFHSIAIEKHHKKNNREAVAHELNFTHVSALVDRLDTNKSHDIAHLDEKSAKTRANDPETGFAKDLVYTVSGSFYLGWKEIGIAIY